ncbi:hypothetical protein BGZ75_009905 [Mortierella antarctica]|nr:hypothetical protein BGZ75_009905 [Mortierella antarctica]
MSAVAAIIAAAIDTGHSLPEGAATDSPGEEVVDEEDEEEDVEDKDGDVMFFKKQLRSTLT